MTTLFGSCHALLGQLGERTLLFLSKLAFRDAKYSTALIQSLRRPLLPFQCLAPSSLFHHHQWVLQWGSFHPSTSSSVKKIPPWSSTLRPVWVIYVPVCNPHRLNIVLTSPSKSCSRWDLKPLEPGHFSKVTRLSAESVSVLGLPPRLQWAQPHTLQSHCCFPSQHFLKHLTELMMVRKGWGLGEKTCKWW